MQYSTKPTRDIIGLEVKCSRKCWAFSRHREAKSSCLKSLSFRHKRMMQRICGTARKCHFLFYLPIPYYLNAQSRQNSKIFKGISTTLLFHEPRMGSSLSCWFTLSRRRKVKQICLTFRKSSSSVCWMSFWNRIMVHKLFGSCAYCSTQIRDLAGRSTV